MQIAAKATSEDEKCEVSDEKIAALAASIRGQVITPESGDYDGARSIWNAMIDRRPALIVRCAGVADVRRAVEFVSTNGLRVAVRGRGHNIAGTGVCDDGVVIDLSNMRSVQVDPHRKRAYVEPGASLGDLDHESIAFNLATTLGINSTTGVAGLTLGGGIGWLARKHGMAVDNLLAANVVTADGRFLRASAEQNPDLFWALRGGGGNFGVVTSFELALHDQSPQILSGLIVHPFDAASDVLRKYRDFNANAPDDLCVWAVLRKAPPLPFLAEEVHGTDVVILAAFWAGEMAEGERVLAPLREVGTPIADVIGPHPYAGWQQAFDPLLTEGARNYWKSHNFAELSDGLIDTLVGYAGKLPSAQSEIFVAQMGGAVNRVAPDATAYPHRDIEYIMNVHTRWENESEDQRCVGWAREFFADAGKYATGGVYVNFVPEDEERVPAAYGENYKRLIELKKKYDPENLFHVNQNIAP